MSILAACRSAQLRIWVTEAEHQQVLKLARLHRISATEIIRRNVFGRPLPDPIPRVNLEVWARLGPLAADLNQYVRALRQGLASGAPLDLLLEIRQLLDALREELRGREARNDREDV